MWHDCFGGVMENGGRRRRVSRGSSSSSISKSKLWDDSRRDPTTEAFSDVFGGPPRSIYSRKLMQEAFSYNQVFKPLKVGVGDSSSRRIAEKGGGGGGSGPYLPVFELPGRSVLPVFELPCCRDRLLHADRRPKSHADDFYDDIFRGAAHAEGCNPEPESSSKSCKFEKSRSRSASSSLSWSPKKDCSPSASKPRPPRHGRCYAFNLSCKDPFRVASRESEETSTAGEAKCCSPDESRRIDNTNAGFPKFRHFPRFQSSPTDRPVGNIRNDKTLRKPDSCSQFDDDQFCSKYSNGVNDGMAPVDYFEPKDCRFSSSSSSKEPWTLRPLVDSIPHPTPPESPNLDDQKPWKDLLNQLPNSISSRTKNSPRSESSHHEREKICESFMDGRHEFNVLGLYPIEYALDEREKFALESKDSHLHDCPVTSDVSDIAVTEAIAWAKEKFMWGACKPESCEELGEDATQALVFRSDLSGGDVEENAKQCRMDIQDEIIVADDGWSPRHEGSFEAHNEIVDHRTKYKQQPGLDRDRTLSTRASSLMLEPEIDLLFHAPELQGAYAIDATFHESTTMGICGMLENQACCKFNAISLDSCEEDFKGTQFASDHEHNHAVAN